MSIFRFTVRELLLVILCCALGLAWFMDHVNVSSRLSKSEEKRTDAVRANAAILKFMESQGFKPDFQRDVYIDK